MKKLILTCLVLSFHQAIFAQSASGQLPYAQIPDTAESYSPGNITSRMIDGLGYRYYWATEGLREIDLEYKATDESRNTLETLQHIFSLSKTIMNTTLDQVNIRPEDFEGMGFQDYREGTLRNLRAASLALAEKNEEEIAELSMVFQSSGSRNELPFWNLINGPLADAIYHTGQVVQLRRISGNPMNPKVNVLMGVTRN